METLKYNRRDKNELFWFVVGTTNKQKELQIRDEARAKGMEAFVPIEYEYKTVRGKQQRLMTPAISGYVFVKATTTGLDEWITNSHYTIYPKKSTFTDKEDFLIVSNHDMENFIAVIEKAEAHITYFKPEEISLQEGDKILIKGGLYDGREGIIMRIKGKRNKHLVVQIPGVIVAAVELAPEMVRIPQNALREKPSKDVDKDKKLLLKTAQRLLFEIPDKYQHETEYYLLENELKRCRERLKTFKGYTPATEAELALPMYLAAVQLKEDIPQAEERLRKATEKLKDSSKLKAQCIEALKIFCSAPSDSP